ncbi:hypothetical protein ACIBQ5_37575, partial [Streptomyces massasporeus]|uniref:hypothetical protein n=1 Tax=Streptomyces massasporeus TaxID=67324 RepID=UPI0037AAE19A
MNIYLLLETPISMKPLPMIRKRTAGQSGPKLLIKSEPPERESRKREPGKHRGNRVEKDLIESETQ